MCFVLQVRWELGVDAVDDVLAKIDKLRYAHAHMLVGRSGSVGESNLIRMAIVVTFCRLLGDTGKRDFQFLANKTFVPAVAGLALPRDNRQVKALHDRVQKVRAHSDQRFYLQMYCIVAMHVLIGNCACQVKGTTVILHCSPPSRG